MKHLHKRRRFARSGSRYRQDLDDDDPLSGLANLFDLGLVFMVGLLLALFAAYRLEDLFDASSEMTILKKSADGELEIITKKGRKIEAVKTTRDKAKGAGQRLGTAYRLEDGSMVYVPEQQSAENWNHKDRE